MALADGTVEARTEKQVKSWGSNRTGETGKSPGGIGGGHSEGREHVQLERWDNWK